MFDYLNLFIKDGQKGIETIEFIGLVVVAAVLIGIVAAIGTSMAERADKANTQMSENLNYLDTFADTFDVSGE